jgi:hypothetical protein
MVNVFRVVSRNEFMAILFADTTITGHKYLNMLKNFLVSQLDRNNAMDPCPRDVKWYLNKILLGRWIGHGDDLPWQSTTYYGTLKDTRGLIFPL